MRRVVFVFGGDDLIRRLVTEGVNGLMAGKGKQGREVQCSLRGRESMENPSNTWGLLLQLQEIK